MNFPCTCRLVCLLAVVMMGIPTDACHGGRGGQLTLKAVDATSGQPIAVRIHLQNARGRSIRPRAGGILPYADHFIMDGETTLQLGKGLYQFEMEAGPEYKSWTGRFEIEDHAEDEKTITMHRFADLAQEGWYAGDLHVTRKNDSMEPLMRAEGLHGIALVADQNRAGKVRSIQPWRDTPVALDRQRWLEQSAFLFDQDMGRLLFFHARPPKSLLATHVDRAAIVAAFDGPRPGPGHLDLADLFAWDLPVWLATIQPDTVQLISDHALRDRSVPASATGRPRDPNRYPGSRGTGRWAEAIYYHLLNCGLRIPPSAGSGSGTTPNPLGQNRVYVHCGDRNDYDRPAPTPRAHAVPAAACDPDTWWSGLRAGHSFVTNGPLLRVQVEGRPPGTIFSIEPGTPREFLIGLSLSTREKVDYLQVVQNGVLAIEVRLDQWAQAGGRLPALAFDASGWFLVRAVTSNRQVYQFASTAPYYVETSTAPRRISRASVEFFQEWLENRPDADSQDPATDRARAFWADLLESANVP